MVESDIRRSRGCWWLFFLLLSAPVSILLYLLTSGASCQLTQCHGDKALVLLLQRSVSIEG
jgi:hypothetical protein